MFLAAEFFVFENAFAVAPLFARAASAECTAGGLRARSRPHPPSSNPWPDAEAMIHAVAEAEGFPQEKNLMLLLE